MPTRTNLSPLSRAVKNALAVTYVPIDQLKPNPKNARIHKTKQIRQIARSIETFGFNVPILVGAKLNVIAGHGRLLACKLLGWTEAATQGPLWQRA
jgi:ParB-like chromosome segregation protein Spo0J